ncbi:MAG: class I SAM-dependent rRNA methyltransferase, partial [Pseudomonadota bacterium]
MPALYVKARQDRRVKRGHLWLYSNEVDVKRTPLDAFEPGDAVDVRSNAGELIGRATVSPNNLICERLFSRAADATLDVPLFETRIRRALALRETAFSTPHYRLVHADGDLLPGLILDRFGDVIVAQIGTAGVERGRDQLLEALENVCTPSAVLWRNDARARTLEGLNAYVEVAAGALPREVTAIEGDLRFVVDPVGGQKTGWYYDQRANRSDFVRWVRGKRVLDVFSYVGGWSVAAAKAGAASVTAVDSSEQAVASVLTNAEANGVSVDALRADASAALKQLRAQGAEFDVIVLDPPALITRRKDVQAGLKHYRALNQSAARLLAPDGILVSCSCS